MEIDNKDEELMSDDIKFDDNNIDINNVQAKLQEHMAKNNVEYDATSGKEKLEVVENSEEASEAPEQAQPLDANNLEIIPDEQANATPPVPIPVPEEPLKILPGEKKYIVYIEPRNIEYFDGLTIKERKKIVNNVIFEVHQDLRNKRLYKEKVKFTNQVIIMVITAVLCLPIFFLMLNKSLELTIINYQQAQQNFVKLYKEQGKIKSYRNFGQNFD